MIMALLALVPMSLLTRFLWMNKSKARQLPSTKEIDPAYFRGLGHLIENEPDKAIDAFSHLLEIDQDTIDLHLFLGCLFRSRGEVSRAIRIHENILARPQLSHNDYAKVQYELARDYLQAGFFNYAETHLKSLIKGKSDYVEPSLQALVNIYEQEKDWLKAIEFGKRLRKLFSVDIAKPLAHYYCEHVLTLKHSRPQERIKGLQLALKEDSDCARASLMLADEYINNMQQVDLAFSAIEAMKLQSIPFIRETVTRMWQLHALGLSSQMMEQFWRQCLELTHDSQIIIALAELIRKEQGDHMAIEFLSMMMRSSPSIPVMLLLVEIYIEHSEGNAKKNYVSFEVLCLSSASRLTLSLSKLRFSGALMYWQCPGCRSWETVQPKDQVPLDHYMEY